ncbi:MULTISPECIES: NUDIX hydrolase [Pseudomonas]|uniref:NUDIX hydrolase n=1 Tax=Pseudomonas TaxID=286 RepID=UPI001C692D11|nr:MULTISPECIES: NUDIX domain-containing protein [Pseudomonas]MDI3204956.1 NUDIX domain-containing protein [Pseudomonas shahriarae]MDZ4302565.1 NUDIX domain-containing protein [Pseudomonas sp.]QYM70272.1 NUDIX domain-containing protein [Pseudomonas sp. So3.2b]
MQLIAEIIHPELKSMQGRVFRRHAARGIVLRDEQILLLFTERYNDFSFPGGGLNAGEDIVTGLKRELEEETGAREIQIRRHYGYIEEYRPYWKPQYDLMHMTSHFYLCGVALQLDPVRMESHEIANGMRPVWINLQEAITHNEAVMQRQESSMGQSIQRETFMLKKIASELMTPISR